MIELVWENTVEVDPYAPMANNVSELDALAPTNTMLPEHERSTEVVG